MVMVEVEISMPLRKCISTGFSLNIMSCDSIKAERRTGKRYAPSSPWRMTEGPREAYELKSADRLEIAGL